MKLKTAAKWVFVSVTVVLIIWDGVVIANKETGDTISEQVWEMSKSRAFVPFAFGWLMGTLFGRSKSATNNSRKPAG